eukprot:gene39210-51635_t
MRSAPGGGGGRAGRVAVIRQAYNESAIQPTTQRDAWKEQSPHSFSTDGVVMSSIQKVHESGATGAAPAAASAEQGVGTVSAPLLLLLATTAGLSVASLYYSQPMLGVLGPDMQADSRVVGLVPTLTQLGYALGILLLAPLGDRFDRRRIIVIKSIALMLALLLSGLAPGMGALLAASLA